MLDHNLRMNKIDRRGHVLVFDREEEIAEFLIRRWEEISQEAIGAQGMFCAALSGGKTPVPFYRRLGEEKERLPWPKTHLFLVDERFVPSHDPDSNYRLLKETVIRQGSIPPENLHPIPTEGVDLQVSATAYEKELVRFFNLSRGQIPRFDLILLGLGEDGHTASLFPNHSVTDDSDHLASPVLLDVARHHRITLTLPVINHGVNVVFLVTGEKKAAVVEKIIHRNDLSLPASRVNPIRGNLLFLLDRGAGSRLTNNVLLSPKNMCCCAAVKKALL